MAKRLLFVLAAAFWVGMMVWLWQAEYGQLRSAGPSVPVSLVWDKILTAPDPSTLHIGYRGTNIGICRWAASAGEAASAALSAGDEDGPRWRPDASAGYRLDLEGSITLADFGGRVGYNVSLKLDEGRHWQEFQGRLKVKPDLFEVQVSAPARTVQVTSRWGGENRSRLLRFDELQNPQKLARELGGPLLPGLLASLGLPLSTNALPRFLTSARWQARQEWLQAGNTRLRVYRLETRLLDRYRVRACVSPVGEILRIELPGEVLLQHEALGNFRSPS